MANSTAATVPTATRDEAREFACAAARVAAENRCEDLRVLDLRGLSGLTDYFVVGTGTSDRQMHAVLERIAEYARSIQRRVHKVADTKSATWILADYVDVMIHIFDAQHRAHYDLDGLWGDAPRVEWNQVAAPASRPA